MFNFFLQLPVWSRFPWFFNCIICGNILKKLSTWIQPARRFPRNIHLTMSFKIASWNEIQIKAYSLTCQFLELWTSVVQHICHKYVQAYLTFHESTSVLGKGLRSMEDKIVPKACQRHVYVCQNKHVSV